MSSYTSWPYIFTFHLTADPKDEMVLPRPHVSGPFIGYSQSPESPVSMETGHVTMDRQTVIMDTREAYPRRFITLKL